MFDFPLAPLAVPPISRRRSTKRFGLPSRARSAAHSEIGTHQILHACWDFFHPSDRLAITIAYPWMGDYARLRRDACVHRSTIAAALRAERPSPDTVPPLCPFRSRFLGAALASFNFRHSSVVRWLGGEFTNSNRNWADLASRVADACATAPPSGYPTLEPVLAMRAFAEGVPLAGRFTSSRRDMIRRFLYNNHPPAIAAASAVRAKFAVIDGLMLSPISWIMQKGKGRLIIDASTLLAPEDTGAPNGHIPPPGEPGRFEENPPVYYSSALRRHCAAVWNLRIGHPRDDLMQHTDDVDSAFRRILYHPILAVVFSDVFQELLLVPVGNIFGSRSAPSWFTTPAEIRAHMANTLEYSSADYELARNLLIPDEPSPDVVLQFAPAVADRLNQGIRSIPRNPRHHAMFVDDNICVAIRSLIAEAVAGAVGSAYECFGDPVTNARRGSVLAAKKFEPTASHRVVFVGYIIDTREMRVIWPEDKRTRARDIIDAWLTNHTSRSPVEVSQLLGLLRHGIAISAAGNFLSIRLQTVMSHCMKSAGQKKIASRAWWHKHRIYIPAEVKRDLRLLRASLEPSVADAHWSRPIGLLIRREPTAVLLSDASYGGIGGWSETFSFCWRLSRQELLDHGIPMKVIDKSGEAVDNGDGIHINILEFIAIIINIWIAITSSIRESPAVGGHYVSVLADNTSALSWLRYAARSRSSVILNLAYMCQSLLFLSQTADQSRRNTRSRKAREGNPPRGIVMDA